MKEIIMYTTSTCPHCKTAKDYLATRGFSFVERNAQLNPAFAHEMREKKLMGVPSFIIGEETLVGFDPKKIETLLDYTVESCPKCSRKMRMPKGKGHVRITCKQCENQFEVESKKM